MSDFRDAQKSDDQGGKEAQAQALAPASRAVVEGAVPASRPHPDSADDDNDADDDSDEGKEVGDPVAPAAPEAAGKEVAQQQRPRSAAAVQSSSSSSSSDDQSMTKALFFSWILPVLILAAISRFTVNLEPEPDLAAGGAASSHKPRPVALNFDGAAAGEDGRGLLAKKKKSQKQHQRGIPPGSVSPSPHGPTAAPSKLPTNYLALVETIDRRRRRVGRFAAPSSSPSSLSSSTPSKDRRATEGGAGGGRRRGQGTLSDPDRVRSRQRLAELQRRHDDDPADLFLALELADAYRLYEVQYHDGGSHEADALRMYEVVTRRVEALRSDAIQRGQATSVPDGGGRDVSDEMLLPYPQRSLDGLLCAVYAGQGKALYMANMFARSVDSYSRCIEVIPEYLDALDARASSYIVLGMYEEAARDYRVVIERDENQLLFAQAYTGMARVLEARENATEGGWDFVVERLAAVIPKLEARHDTYPQGRQVLAPALNRLHHVMFTYNDVKTKNYTDAFRHLTKAFEYKMSILPPWTKGIEALKVEQTKQIFKAGFWPEGIGSPSRVPVFIIGFVRSGSTLLERVLDAHPSVVGTGENSVFNGRLDEIRNRIVQVSSSRQPEMLATVTQQLADDVVDEMKRRWQVLEANTDKPASEVKVNPLRFVDKMLTNYYNVGFIHLLYPNALILHVAREPMDTIFSAYKHEFPPGTLDYTSDMEALAELYHAYRDLIEHWDQVLPGRVTHVRYQDMVNDMPGVARAIINATGLPWDESVLDFHKKKHAVNTLSSTQVRRGVYKDSLKAWMRYKDHLGPLLELVGDRVEFDMKTTLPAYRGLDRHVDILADDSSMHSAALSLDEGIDKRDGESAPTPNWDSRNDEL